MAFLRSAEQLGASVYALRACGRHENLEKQARGIRVGQRVMALRIFNAENTEPVVQRLASPCLLG